MNLNELADSILTKKHTKSDEVQNLIHPDIMIRYNSVNVLIGKRGSGKTYWLSKELLKIAYNPNNRFTQVYYISDKTRDETFEYVQQHIKNIEIVWVKTDNALKVIEALTHAKAKFNEEGDEGLMCRKALNAENSDEVPHTLIVFDDCIGLFSKQTKLSKRLYENRQSHITYILALQDVQGLSPSMKSNIDALVLFGSYSRQKYNILTYQLPVVEGLDWDSYSMLQKNDYMFVDFIDSTVQIVYREE